MQNYHVNADLFLVYHTNVLKVVSVSVTGPHPLFTLFVDLFIEATYGMYERTRLQCVDKILHQINCLNINELSFLELIYTSAAKIMLTLRVKYTNQD